MTAEVAILNKQAVAMAADSAVTSHTGKIFNTNKLFGLSTHDPIGIMIFNAADVMGVPAETIIKDSRKRELVDQVSTLEECANRFEEFLRTDARIFAPDKRRESAEYQCWEVIDWIKTRAVQSVHSNERQWSTQAEARAALTKAVDVAQSRIDSAADLAPSSPAFKARIRPACDAAIDVLERAFPVSKAERTRIRNLVIRHFAKDLDFGGHTGFVICGFGKDDLFPRLRSFQLCCASSDYYKVIERQAIDIGITDEAAIAPFAQDDVMSTFVEGAHPTYAGAIKSFMTAFIREEYAMLAPADQAQADIILNFGRRLVQQVDVQTREMTRRWFVAPLVEVVSRMPKEELASLAEALVNLTSLKRKASDDMETVGGPTDVAVISKGDGFVWMKRKHYFEMRLNPGFYSSQ